MKFLLIGKNGQLGWELQRTCMHLGEIVAVDYPEVDIANTAALRELIRSAKPDILLNPAAYTNVDKAESEPELARQVNAIGPGVMAEEMKKLGGAFIHYSTDYVFDGTAERPYVETEAPNPINQYGISKLEGEQRVLAAGGNALVFRTSWVYSLRQGGFVNKVLQWSREQEVMRIVDDQTGSPTWARMLAQASTQVITRGGDDALDYLEQNSGLYQGRAMPLLATRGCPYRCTFCSQSIMPIKWRARSSENVIEEWRHLVRDLGALEIGVLDDSANIRKNRLIELADALIADRLNHVPWIFVNGIRANLADYDMLIKLKQAGLKRTALATLEKAAAALGRRLHIALV